MMKTIALIVMMVVNSNVQVTYHTEAMATCPPRAALDKWEALINESVFGNEVRATALCLRVPVKFPQREA